MAEETEHGTTESKAVDQQQDCSALRAWKVSTDDSEASVIAFAETAAAAKQIGHTSEWLCNEEWTALRATRLPAADKYADRGRTKLDGSCKLSAEVMHALGWYQIESGAEECDTCGLHEWDGVPESKLKFDEESGEYTCASCLEQNKALSETHEN